MSRPSACVLSAETWRALELPSLLRLVAELATTDLGRRRILDLEPLAAVAALERRQALFREAAPLLADGALIPSLEAPVTPLVERLLRGRGERPGADLLLLGSLLRATREAAERIRAEPTEGEPERPALTALVEALPDLEPIERRIRRSLDRRGQVRDDASPELGRLRRQVIRQRGELYSRLEGVVGEHRDHLAEETVPMHGGRLVLMLQAGARGRVDGIVHGRSSSGRSFYFEPLAAVEPNNRLQEALGEEEAERSRILGELVSEVVAAAESVERHVELAGELDVLQAAHRFAERCGGRLAEIAPPHRLLLVQARHPLLDPRLAELREAALGQAGHRGEIVPLDLELDAEKRVLVVTGPNAGGKTVALKTLGLVALASQCGLPVPVGRGTRLPVFSACVATVGDEQDLLADRSTFSGRLQRLDEAWRRADPGALVLLDELGSGTDPSEGAALAIALLEALLDRRPLAFVTTHLTQVAATALEREGASCAAMEFDPESGRPTFRLLPGPPGGSEAIALARRLGLDPRWVERAEELLGSEHRDLARLLAEVESLRGELAAERAAAERERRDVERLRRRAADEERRLIEERRGLADRFSRELDEFRRRVRRELGTEVERIRGEMEEGRRRGLAAAAAERLFADAPQVADEEAADGRIPEPGDAVRHRGLGFEGVLEELNGARAVVASGGKRLRCELDDLVVDGEARPAPARGEKRVRVTRAGGDGEDGAGSELHLIGKRVEPALAELDTWLDRALLDAHREVRVVHGHGTGRLRRAVREHLRGHPAVASLRAGEPGEGGDGATVVRLAGS